MIKKYVKYNVLMALALLFAIFYQSFHVFTDEIHHLQDDENQKYISKTHFSNDNQEDCPICDFEFANFLSSNIFSFKFINPFHKFHFSNLYVSIVKEKEFLCFLLRGPPKF